MITLFFRYDDYSEISPFNVDAGIAEMVHSLGVTCTFAVIPAVTTGDYHAPGDRDELPLGDRKIQLLKHVVKTGAVEIALHGWNHRTHPRALPPLPSEFSGLPLNDQIERIRRGYDFLLKHIGAPAQTFVPPWNEYDLNTLRAIQKVGINTISANRYAMASNSIRIDYLPITAEIRDLRKAVAFAQKWPDRDVTIGVMLHPFDFSESRDCRAVTNLLALKSEIQWLKKNYIQIRSISQLAKTSHCFNAQRLRYNGPTPIECIYPPFLKKSYQTPVYLPLKIARRKWMTNFLSGALFHIVVISGSFGFFLYVLDHAVFDYSVVLRVLLGFIFLFLALAIIGRSLRNKAIYFKAMVILSLIFGSFLALFI